MKISRMNPFDGSSKTVAFFDVETEESDSLATTIEWVHS